MSTDPDNQSLILKLIDERGSVRSDELSKELGMDHQKIVGTIKSLQTHEGVTFLRFSYHLGDYIMNIELFVEF